MAQKAYAVWTRLSHKTLYKGRVHIVEFEAVLPSGEHTTYEVDHGTNGAVAVFIKTPDNKIVLTHQYRFPLDAWIYDLPGGGKKDNEAVEEAAIRECREEVGLAPKKLEQLVIYYPNPARTSWPMRIFYCDSFEASKIELHDTSENVETVLMPIIELKKRIDNQEIVDPGLLIAWHTARSKGYIRV